MARQKTIAAESKLPEMNEEAVRTALIAADEMAVRSTEIMEKFGDGLPYDRLRLLDRCRFHMARSAEEALAVGRCLIVMKEHEPYGEWMELLGQLGLNYRLAARMMQATLKLANVSSTPHLLEATKNKTKLFELMVLDDEELQELSEGGTVAGMDLDDVSRMSVSELRDALREAKEESKAKDRLLADKNAKIDELATHAEKPKRKTADTPWPEQYHGLKSDIARLGGGADEIFGRFLTVVDAAEVLLDQTPENHLPAAHSVIHHAIETVDRLCTLAAGLRHELETRLAFHVDEARSHILPAEA